MILLDSNTIIYFSKKLINIDDILEVYVIEQLIKIRY